MSAKQKAGKIESSRIKLTHSHSLVAAHFVVSSRYGLIR